MENKYGVLTVAYNSEGKREIPIKNFVSLKTDDGRTLFISTLENNEGYFISINNPKESGREPINQMWLSPKSFNALVIAFGFFIPANEINTEKIAREIGEVKYDFSDNLKNPFEDIK